ncbi:MAG: hypothetical protein AAF577_02560 [Pseudomonadota bacterium]
MAIALTDERHPLSTVDVPALLRNDSGDRFERKTILAKFRSDHLKALINALKEVRNHADAFQISDIRFLMTYYDKVYRLKRIIDAVRGKIAGELAERNLKEKFGTLETQVDTLISSLIAHKGLNDRPFFMPRTRAQAEPLWTSMMVGDEDLKKVPSLWTKAKAHAREQKGKIKMAASVVPVVSDAAKLCSAAGHMNTALALEAIEKDPQRYAECKPLPGSLLGKLGGARQEKHEAIHRIVLPHLIERQRNRSDDTMTGFLASKLPVVGKGASGLLSARKKWKWISGADDEKIRVRREHAFWLTEHFLTHDCALAQAIVSALFGPLKMEDMKTLCFWDCRAVMYKAFE